MPAGQAKGVSEDWLSVWIGLLIFVLSLGVFVGADVLGWGVTAAVWIDPSRALAPVSKAYSGLSGLASLVLTYVFLLLVMTAGAAAVRVSLGASVRGFSICGVSAAIATAGAIKARPIVPIMISSLVVVFSCVELLILPFLAQGFLYTEPMVAGGWMGLAVKTDGAAVASGAITDSLIRAKALAVQGVRYQEGW